MYRAMGHAHAGLHRAGRALREGAGQGTVEYVALILLVALIMAGVVAGMSEFRTDEGRSLADTLIDKLKSAVRKVAF